MSRSLKTSASIVVVALAAAVAGGCGTSGQAPKGSPASAKSKETPSNETPSKETPSTVKPGTYRINRALVNPSQGSGAMTLDRIEVRPDHKLIARVVYKNLLKAAATYSCVGVSDPTSDTLALPNGNVIKSEKTYCSTNPTKQWSVKAGGKFTSFAEFTIPEDFPQPFTFNWYANQSAIAGAVSNITLSS